MGRKIGGKISLNIMWFIEEVVDAATVYEAAKQELRSKIYTLTEVLSKENIVCSPPGGEGRIENGKKR